MDFSRAIAKNNANYNTTDRGTPIVKPGEDMDKDAFLTILSAQLRNQDPMAGDQDSTQYVTQMAQFSTMEQMQNLNKTMTDYSEQNLVGKGVTVDVLDSNGKPYTGIVKSVNTEGSSTSISMEVSENGKNVYKEFPVESIVSILEVPNFSLPAINNVNGNTSFLLASSFIGKEVKLSEKNSSDENYVGSVIGAFKDNGVIKVNVKLEDSEEVIAVTIDKVVSVGDVNTEANTETKPEEDKDETTEIKPDENQE
ncbi:flagellar hook capping FlgD N-terminal domain-containing protein [uncultured Clostridium sp.]|jgi:flagellar basal-body rod modification protein FlgD|uniref:flagellar hook assembly protein FlgD n=1 Tax=uncultured Clostridium sp. TaxID=59620 RepID=UPI00261438A3|nr:flagellar hook capping FlgD N-terminal domain-containing protein [uncultured Clostridium sp.]